MNFPEHSFSKQILSRNNRTLSFEEFRNDFEENTEQIKKYHKRNMLLENVKTRFCDK